MNIAIIGLGNIGFRHYQSILELGNEHNLFFIDKSDSAIEKCKNYKNKNYTVKNIFFSNQIQKISANLEIIIIATNSFPRKSIIEEIFHFHKPKYIILEKFLFPKIEDYFFCKSLFESNSTKVWVNQWMSSEFIEISRYFPSNKKIKFSITGKNWGLCSNSVHFIDWFHALTERKNLEVISTNFSNLIYESRREEYRELMGSFCIQSIDGHELNLTCEKKSNDEEIGERSIFIKISNIDYVLKAEFDGVKLFYKINDKKINSISENIIYVKPQSKKTSDILRTIIKSNTCNLVNYNISMEQHLLVYNEFLNTFSNNGFDIKSGIPVT